LEVSKLFDFPFNNLLYYLDNEIDDEGAIAIAKYLKRNTLTKLSLFGE
jgi:hypothetical protein